MGQVSQKDNRYRSLDLWRGLACLLVVLDHTAQPALGPNEVAQAVSGFDFAARSCVLAVTRLGLGPPFFFVISGYCIASAAVSMRRKGKPPIQFLARRFQRTFPPYWIALLFFATVVGLLDIVGLERLHRGPYGLALPSLNELDLTQWVGNLTLTETWRHWFWGSEQVQFTRVAWSLCYQEQFYAVCFLVVLLAPHKLFKALSIFTAVVLSLRIVAWDSGALHRLEGLFPIYWHQFAIGLLAYWRLNAADSPKAKHSADLLLLATCLTALFAEDYSSSAAAGFGLSLVLLHKWDSSLSQFRFLSPLRACGVRCYSIYLIHLPVCSIGNMVLHNLGLSGFWTRAVFVVPVSASLAVLAGCLFYRTVEIRFVNQPDSGRPLTVPARELQPSPTPA